MPKKKSKVKVIAILMFSVLLIGFASVFPTEFSKAHADSEDIWSGKEYIPIDSKYFPDQELRAIINEQYGNNGRLYRDTALAVDELFIEVEDLEMTFTAPDTHIKNLKGIEYFSNITRLVLDDTVFVGSLNDSPIALDLTANSNLESVEIAPDITSYSNVVSLKVTGNPFVSNFSQARVKVNNLFVDMRSIAKDWDSSKVFNLNASGYDDEKLVDKNVYITDSGFLLEDDTVLSLSYDYMVSEAQGNPYDYGYNIAEYNWEHPGSMHVVLDLIYNEILPLNSKRLYGQSRYETSNELVREFAEMMVHQDLFSQVIFDTFVVATGTNYPDALSGACLAQENFAPIVLINAANEQQVADFVEEFHGDRPFNTVYILGGTGVISDSFTSKLDAKGYNYKRLGGANRYETNLQILSEIQNLGDELIVATGLNYPDALSASSTKKPVLLVGGSLREDQKAFLREHNFKTITILGGPMVVSDTVKKELSAYGKVRRIFGENRYETSAKIGAEYYPDAYVAVLATGTNYPDALAGGSMAATIKAPILLATSKPQNYKYAKDYLATTRLETAYILGGPSLISDEAAWDILVK